MSDDKTKRGHPDRDLFNAHEPYEVEQAVRDLKKEFPTKSKVQIQKALLDSAKVEQFHHRRPVILTSARIKLKNL